MRRVAARLAGIREMGARYSTFRPPGRPEARLSPPPRPLPWCVLQVHVLTVNRLQPLLTRKIPGCLQEEHYRHVHEPSLLFRGGKEADVNGWCAGPELPLTIHKDAEQIYELAFFTNSFTI